MKFIVIGGDAAGMSAASRAKRNKPDMEVIVLEQTADVSYSACGMPYNIADPERQMDDLVVRHAQVFREKQGIELRTGHRVQTIDTSCVEDITISMSISHTGKLESSGGSMDFLQVFYQIDQNPEELWLDIQGDQHSNTEEVTLVSGSQLTIQTVGSTTHGSESYMIRSFVVL